MADNYYLDVSYISRFVSRFNIPTSSSLACVQHSSSKATEENPADCYLSPVETMGVDFGRTDENQSNPSVLLSNEPNIAWRNQRPAEEKGPADCFLSPVEYVKINENQSNASAICSDQKNMAWNNRRPVQKRPLGNEIFGAEGGIFREKANEPAEFSLLKKPNPPVSDWPPIVQVERNRNGETALTDCIDWGCPRVTASLMDILGISNAADRLSPSFAAGAETGPIGGPLEIQTQNHRRGKEKPFWCGVCPKVFARKGHLDEHRRAHTGEKPHGCNICGKNFVSQRTLRTHLRIHTGENLFECKTCGQKFTTNCTLTHHLRKHSGEKPFDCNICFKRFTQKGTLTRHFRVHTKEKPFNCDICGKRFAQKISFKIHLLTHTGE